MNILTILTACVGLIAPQLSSIPSEWDWRDYGVVSPVKNQGTCGSCWAFSSAGAVESAYAIATNKSVVSLSEQELIDCASKDGCGGGFMDNAFHWIETHKGLCLEKEYPYIGRDGVCKRCTPMVRVKDYVDVPKNSHDALLKALLKQPIAIAIEADQYAFQMYRGGVMKGRCGTNLDHGVLLVGYGTEDGDDYWLIKNSWGVEWGDNGYIKILRTHERGPGHCGIYLQASYPVIDLEYTR